MPSHTIRRRLLSLASCAGLAAGLGLFALPQAASAEPTSHDLTEAVRATMLAERGDTARDQFGTSSLKTPLVEPIETTGAWAFGTTTIPAPSTAHATPTTALFVAHDSGEGWRVELRGSDAFVDLTQRAPEKVVSEGEKDLFAKNHRAAQRPRPLADTGLGLPWREGVAWWMGGGPHGNSGSDRPYSSIDFNGGTGRVLSAGPGRVYKSCARAGSALVTVVHDNGYSTSYYHMTNLTSADNGAPVELGGYLGHIGNELPCGGSSTGAHVHLSLLRGGSHISVDNMTIGGWTFHTVAQPYNGYATRNGQRVGRGGRLTNYGPGGLATPAETVDHAVPAAGAPVGG